jgi:hypothetical protein
MFATCAQTNLAAQMVINGPIVLSGKGFAPLFLLAELPRALRANHIVKATFCALELAHFSVLLGDTRSIQRGSAFVSAGMQEYLDRHPECQSRKDVLDVMREAGTIVRHLSTCLLTCAMEAARPGLTMFVRECLDTWQRGGYTEKECIVTAVHALFSVKRMEETFAPAATALQAPEARAMVQGWMKTTMLLDAERATKLLHVR